MHRWNRWLLAATALALLASTVWAQQPFARRGFMGGPSTLMLLNQKSVQDELKLTAEQKKHVEEASTKVQEEMQGLRDQDLEQAERFQKMRQIMEKGDKAAAAILKPEQARRLKQIHLQQEGPLAVTDPEIAKDLNLTDEQKQKVRDIQEETRTQMRDAFQGGNREKIAEIRKEANEKVEKLLTAEQKARWKEMAGEPFKGEIRFGPPGGGRRDRQP